MKKKEKSASIDISGRRGEKRLYTPPRQAKKREIFRIPSPKELGGTTHCISQLHSYLHQKTAYGIGSSIDNHMECGTLLSYRLHSVLI